MSRYIIEDMNSVPEICNQHEETMYWYGDWYCSKCQQEEQWMEQESEAQWYSDSRLCQLCRNTEGPDYNDKCIVYKMPLYMVKRKRKCKYYKELEEYDYE